jgi:hypothetical protein
MSINNKPVELTIIVEMTPHNLIQGKNILALQEG